MRYLSEIYACKTVKDPVKLYIATNASEKYTGIAERLCQNVTKGIQKHHRAYLSKYASFADKEIVFAEDGPDLGIFAHEKWHQYLQKFKIDSSEGDFIEEASASVIEDVQTGEYHRHLGHSREFFIPTYLLIQKLSPDDMEKVLLNFGKRIPEWDDNVMKGSCVWLKFIDDAKYMMLYDLCFDVCANHGIKNARVIYRKAMQSAKKRGIMSGIRYLKRFASKGVAALYDFEFDIGGFFPTYDPLVEYSFYGGGIQIEAYGAHRSWIRPLEDYIRIKKLIPDEYGPRHCAQGSGKAAARLKVKR
jgi:hypothetical protein